MKITLAVLFGLLVLVSHATSAKAAAETLTADVPTATKPVIDYIVAHPGASLDEVVEFANKSVLPRFSMPALFYNLKADGTEVALAPVRLPGGKSVKFEEGIYDACGLKTSSATVRRLGDNDLVVALNGADTKLKMPPTFKFPRITTTLDGQKKASFPVPGGPLPYAISQDGKSAFYPIFLVSPAFGGQLHQWFAGVRKTNPGLRLESARLSLQVSEDGFKFSSDAKTYEHEAMPGFSAKRQGNGTYTASWDKFQGPHVTISDTCVTDMTSKVDFNRNILTLPKYDQKKFSAEMAAGKPVALLFTKTTCPVCHRQVPVLEEVFKEDPYKKLTVYQVDFLQQGDVNAQFKVSEQNTLVLFKKGQEIARSHAMTEDEALKKFLGKILR